MWDLIGSQCKAQRIRDIWSDLAEWLMRGAALFWSFEVYRSDFCGTQQEVNYSNQSETE